MLCLQISDIKKKKKKVNVNVKLKMLFCKVFEHLLSLDN